MDLPVHIERVLEVGEDIEYSIRGLAFHAKVLTESSRSKDYIAPEQKKTSRLKVTEFKYEDTGVSSSGYAEDVVEVSWSNAIAKIVGLGKKSEEYSSALESVTNTTGDRNSSPRYLDSFVSRIAQMCLCDSTCVEGDMDAVVRTFVRELQGEPIRYSLKAKLDGIILRPTCIRLDEDVYLRKTTPEDLQEEYPMSIFFGTRTPRTPSAILEIERLSKGVEELQGMIDKAVTILRLLKAGSVRCLRYIPYSESITKSVGGIVSIDKGELSLETCLVKEEDVPKLKTLWQIMVPKVGVLLSPMDEHNHLAIAYSHYSGSLLKSASVEARTTEAVEGLESLFTGNEEEGLLYRIKTAIASLRSEQTGRVRHHLRRRMRTIFVLLGYDSKDLSKLISHAYTARSAYSHGAILSQKKRRKIERDCGDVTTVLLRVIDLLRVSLIVALLSGCTRDEFLKLIDESPRVERQQTALSETISRTGDVM